MKYEVSKVKCIVLTAQFLIQLLFNM